MSDAPLAATAAADLDLARRVIETEASAILGLVPQLDDAFVRAVDLLERCTGRVVTTGMGKSGIIAHKLAATFSSTGTPAVFLHPAEALHGDLGVVQSGDVVVALSQSGETEELVRLLESIKRLGARLIAMCGNPRSTLGAAADVVLSCSIAEEACPMNLAPTASTTATLALGDALALVLSRRKGFREEHFATLHPGGRLGKRLTRVEALMHGGPQMPAVRRDTAMPDVIHEMTSKRLGMTCVVDADGRLAGIVTDGDIRRQMLATANLLERRAEDVMTGRPITVRPSVLAAEAVRLMEERKITALVVVDDRGAAIGVVHLHDLWQTNLV